MTRSIFVAALVVAAGALHALPAVAAPASYSVTLSATPTTLETAYYATLTTTTNRDLTGTTYTTYLYDQTDPSWVRTCKSSCSFRVTQFAAGAHTYVSYVAREKPNPMYPPNQVKATSSPVTVTWTASTFTVSLEADRTWLPPGQQSVLTARTNKDVAGTAVELAIFDQTSGSRVARCTSGTTCSVTVSETSMSTRTYQAFVAEPSVSPPPPHAQASSEPVTVTWSLLPDPRRPPNVGGGSVTGTVHFDGDGVPASNQPCAATNFNVRADSVTAWINASVTAYVGQLTIVGSGGSTCENATAGSGKLLVSASGTTSDLSLTCTDLAGTFARVGPDVAIVVTGDCTINQFEAFRITFSAHGEFFPTNDPREPVTEAVFGGAFAVFPA